jgi:prevent-host-death family protein
VAKAINVHQAKTHLSRLLKRVHAGEEIVIAKAGKPVAWLVPAGQSSRQRPLGFVPGRLTRAFFSPLPEKELKAWK